MPTDKVILLNALVTSSRIPMVLKTIPISLEEVKELIKNKDIVSYIGHLATARLLSQLLLVDIPVNRAMYSPEPGDVAIVARLKKRLDKPEDVENISINDIEFIVVEYYHV